jgi:hypothetical protein
MDQSFRRFLDTFLDIWRSSSIDGLKDFISKDYQAREITEGEIVDFGFEESVQGWEQGFNFVKENNAQWKLYEISIMPLKDNEVMAVIFATMVIGGKSLATGNLFFYTFKKDHSENWKLIRSYIEAGIANENLNLSEMSLV